MRETTYERIRRLIEAERLSDLEGAVLVATIAGNMETSGVTATARALLDGADLLLDGRRLREHCIAAEWVEAADFYDEVIRQIQEDGMILYGDSAQNRWNFPELDAIGVQVLASGNPEECDHGDYGTIWIKVHESDIEHLGRRSVA